MRRSTPIRSRRRGRLRRPALGRPRTAGRIGRGRRGRLREGAAGNPRWNAADSTSGGTADSRVDSPEYRGDEGTQVWVFCPRGRQTDLPRARSCSASAGTLLADSLSRLSGKGASYPHHSAGVRLGRLAFRTRQKLAKAYVAAPGPGPAGRGRTRSDATCRWSAREPSVEGRARAAGACQQRHQSSRRRYPAGLASSTQAAGRCRSLRKTASAYATDRGRAGRVRPA